MTGLGPEVVEDVNDNFSLNPDPTAHFFFGNAKLVDQDMDTPIFVLDTQYLCFGVDFGTSPDRLYTLNQLTLYSNTQVEMSIEADLSNSIKFYRYIYPDNTGTEPPNTWFDISPVDVQLYTNSNNFLEVTISNILPDPGRYWLVQIIDPGPWIINDGSLTGVTFNLTEIVPDATPFGFIQENIDNGGVDPEYKWHPNDYCQFFGRFPVTKYNGETYYTAYPPCETTLFTYYDALPYQIPYNNEIYRTII